MTTPIPNCPQEDKPIRERAWTDGQIAQVDVDELRVLRTDAKSALGMVELLKQARQRLDDVHAKLYCLRTIIDENHSKGALLEYTDKVINLSRYQTSADAPTAEQVPRIDFNGMWNAMSERSGTPIAEPVAQGEAELLDMMCAACFSSNWHRLSDARKELRRDNLRPALEVLRPYLAAQSRAVPSMPDCLLVWANAEDGGDPMYDAARHHVREMLRVRPSVPDGWVLVPTHPTYAMCNAAHIGPNCGETALDASCRAFWEDCYAAMIGAAPQPGEPS